MGECLNNGCSYNEQITISSKERGKELKRELEIIRKNALN